MCVLAALYVFLTQSHKIIYFDYFEFSVWKKILNHLPSWGCEATKMTEVSDLTTIGLKSI
jgi:hypothetical protein